MPAAAEARGAAVEPPLHQQPRDCRRAAGDSKATVRTDCDGCNGAPQQNQSRRLNRWMARRARAADVLLLLVELLFLNGPDAVSLLAAISCTSECSGGSSSSSADCGIGIGAGDSSFPCGASFWQQALFTLRSGAPLDLRLQLRARDYGGFAIVSGQLLTLLLALLAPSLYYRVRHALAAAISVGTVLGTNLSASLASGAVLPLTSARGARHRVASVYFGWKAAAVFRVPASQQLFLGPALWLLAVAALPAVERSVPPQLHSSPWAVHAVTMFVVMAVLPYLFARTWESASRRPRCDDSLRSCAAAGPGGRADNGGSAIEGATQTGATRASSGGSAVKGADTQADSILSRSNGCGADNNDTGTGAATAAADSVDGAMPQTGTAPAAPAAPPPSLRLQPAASSAIATCPRVQPPTLTIPRRPDASSASSSSSGPSNLTSTPRCVLYRPNYTVVVSAKLPIRCDDPSQPGCPTFEQAAASVATAAAAALRTYNASLRTRVCGSGSSGDVVPPLRCLSSVCVRGCVQLLFMVHRLAGQQQEGGGGAVGIPVGHIPVRHLSLSAASAADDQGAVDASAIDAAVRQLLVAAEEEAGRGGSGGDSDPRVGNLGGSRAGAGSASNHFAFAWPSALPIVVAAPTAAVALDVGEVRRGECTEREEGEVVVVVVAAAALRGLRSVRCVVAGPSGQLPQSQLAAVYVDVEVEVELLRPPHEGDGRLAAIRLALPPHALRTAGLRVLHLLPPHTAAGAAPAGSSATVATTAAVPSAAPLATLPLLVLPAAAAREVRELYGDVMGSAAVGRLEQLLLRPEAIAEPAGLAPHDGADRSDPIAATEESGSCLAAATAALQASGLTALVLDMGALLQLPYGGAEGGDEHWEATEDVHGQAADPSGVDAKIASEVLHFLTARRMPGCVREVQRAVRRAGVQLVKSEADPLGGSCSDGGEENGLTDENAALEETMGRLLRTSAAGLEAASVAMAVTQAGAVPSATASLQHGGDCSSGDAGPSSATFTPRAGSNGGGGGRNVFTSAAAATAPAAADSVIKKEEAKPGGGGGVPATAADSGGGGVEGPQPSPRRARLAHTLWWLRVLLCGFPQRPHEAAYQAYKAVACRAQDSLALTLYVTLRIATTLRTYRDATAGASSAYAVGGDGPCAGLPTVRPALLEGCCGGATSVQLQLAAQCLYLVAGLASMGLALCTRMHARRRNELLLLRGVIDGTALLLVLLPVPWPGPLLSPPDPWIQANRQVGIHWIVFGFWEPLTLQLSPYLQALHGLIYLLPMILLGYHTCYHAWRPALYFGFGHIACTLVVSAATDFHTRCQYVRRRRQGGPSVFAASETYTRRRFVRRSQGGPSGG